MPKYEVRLDEDPVDHKWVEAVKVDTDAHWVTFFNQEGGPPVAAFPTARVVSIVKVED